MFVKLRQTIYDFIRGLRKHDEFDELNKVQCVCDTHRSEGGMKRSQDRKGLVEAGRSLGNKKPQKGITL